ncbi:MAG: hypothetical protein K6F00_08900 [Lachnospiraceae bacterium]|nr:hypothetical protein [Lachnospiraceae bacterium]
MKTKVYSSVYIGTYETSLMIYEINQNRKEKIKLIEDLRLPISINHDLLSQGRITTDIMERLITTLSDMKKDIDMYMSDKYEVFISYAIRRASNFYIIMDRIKTIFPENVRVISNSEQRLRNYEALANIENFDEIIKESALIADVGGSSLQFTLFENGKIVTTQHMALGASVIMESILQFAEKPDGANQLSEMIDKEIDTFVNMYFPKMNPKYLILFNTTIKKIFTTILKGDPGTIFDKKKTERLMEFFEEKGYFSRLFREFSVNDPDRMHIPFILLYSSVVKNSNSEFIIIPDVSTHDGFTYKYAMDNKLLKSAHDFDEDVISASWELAKRFDSYKPHLKMLESLSISIFDGMKKYHGLTNRHGLFIRAAAILHDVGKYINLYASGEATYAIIMSSEIIGLTHDERKLIALVCRYNHARDVSFETVGDGLSGEDYIVFLKLLAILRVANALDRSHKQKMKDVKTTLKDGKLTIRISSKSSLNLEKGMFDEKADFFEEVFGIRPVIVERSV